jgi:putative flippase GtrA
MKLGLSQFLGFVVAGGLATIVNYGLFLLLLSQGAHHLFAASLGYVSGIGISYLVNRLVVFRSDQKTSTESVKYFLSYLVALFFQLVALEILVSAGVVAELANGIAIGGVVFLNFFVVRRFVFGNRKPRSSSKPVSRPAKSPSDPENLPMLSSPVVVKRIGLVWILVVGAVAAFRLIRTHTMGGNSWITSDWLINYEGGFVRRGLVGEILLGVTDYLGLNLLLITGIFIAALWLTYLGFIAAIWWRNEHRGLRDLFVLVSPAFFAFNLWDFQGGFRKELLLLLFFIAFTLRFRKEHRTKPGILELIVWAAFYALGALAHEIFIFAIPMFILLIVLHRLEGTLSRTAMWTMLLLLFSFTSTATVLLLNALGTADQQTLVCSSLVDRGYGSALCGGAIAYIGSEAALIDIGVDWSAVYLVLGGLAALPFLRQKAVNLNLGLVFLATILSLLALFLVGMDWGRWIYLAASFVSIIYLRFGKVTHGGFPSPRKLTNNAAVACPALALWALGWSIPHYAANFFGPGVLNILGGFQ